MAALPDVGWVVLDLVGTLVYPEPDVPTAYQHVGRMHGLDLHRSCIVDRFSSAMAAADWSVVDEEGQRLAWRHVVGQVFQEPPAIEEIFSALWAHFAQTAAWRVYADVVPFLKRASAAGLPVCIASNFDGRLHPICEGLGLAAHCEAVWGSVDLGFAKPDSRFFHAIAATRQCPPEQLCMIGDDWRHDVEGAKRAGWQAIWLCRDGDAGADGDSGSDAHADHPSIQTLDAL